MRHEKTCIFISRVEPLRKPEMGLTSTSHFKFFVPYLDATSIPLDVPLIGTSSFNHKLTHSTMLDLFLLMLRRAGSHTMSLPLEPTFALEALIPFCFKEVKLARLILSHMAFYSNSPARESDPGASQLSN